MSPKQFRLSDGDTAGFENGQRIPVTWPEDGETDDPPTRDLVLAALEFVTRAATPAEVGERAITLAYLFRDTTNAPDSLRELGRRLGCSHTAARRKVSTFKQQFAKELSDFHN